MYEPDEDGVYLVPDAWVGIDHGKSDWQKKFYVFGGLGVDGGAICFPIAYFEFARPPYVSQGRLSQQTLRRQGGEPFTYSQFLLDRGWVQFRTWEELEGAIIAELFSAKMRASGKAREADNEAGPLVS